MENYMYLVPVAAVLALLFAAYLAAKVSKQDAGTDRMKEIAGAIAEGAECISDHIQTVFNPALYSLHHIHGCSRETRGFCSWSDINRTGLGMRFICIVFMQMENTEE